MDRCLSPMGERDIAVAGQIDRDKLRSLATDAIRTHGNPNRKPSRGPVLLKRLPVDLPIAHAATLLCSPKLF